MIPYVQREPKLEKINSDNWRAKDAWYDHLINEWIPNQPDSEELIDLFIDCKFDPLAFLCILNPTEKSMKIFNEKYQRGEDVTNPLLQMV